MWPGANCSTWQYLYLSQQSLRSRAFAKSSWQVSWQACSRCFVRCPLPPFLYFTVSLTGSPLLPQPMVASQRTRVRIFLQFHTSFWKLASFLLKEMSTQDHPCYFLPNLTASLSPSSCLGRPFSVFASLCHHPVLRHLRFLFPHDPWEIPENKMQGSLLPMCWPCNSVDWLVNRAD